MLNWSACDKIQDILLQTQNPMHAKVYDHVTTNARNVLSSLAASLEHFQYCNYTPSKQKHAACSNEKLLVSTNNFKHSGNYSRIYQSS